MKMTMQQMQMSSEAQEKLPQLKEGFTKASAKARMRV